MWARNTFNYGELEVQVRAILDKHYTQIGIEAAVFKGTKLVIILSGKDQEEIMGKVSNYAGNIG